MKAQSKYTDKYVLIANTIDGCWPDHDRHTFTRDELFSYLSQEFMGYFNKGRGEFDVDIYRVPEEGLRIRRKWGYYYTAQKKHRVLSVGYMTADKFTKQEVDGSTIRWTHKNGTVEITIP